MTGQPILVKINKDDVKLTNHYLPTYSLFPENNIPYEVMLETAVRRALFLDKLTSESSGGFLAYSSLRDISLSYHIPLKRFQTNQKEIEEDEISFFSLYAVSLLDQESIVNFANHESLLLFYRLRVSGISPTEIPLFFWSDCSLRKKLLQGLTPSDNPKELEIFEISFETALFYFKPSELDIRNGKAKITTSLIYKLLANNFEERIIKTAEKFQSKIIEKTAILNCLKKDLKILTTPKLTKILSLENIDIVAPRSFPPCMLRIFNNIRTKRFLSYKGRFEYILFLKSAGFDFFQQNAYWRDKVPDVLKLNLKKFYGFNEDKKDFQPHSCVTMTSKECPPNSSIAQGCPFKSMKKTEMNVFLHQMKEIRSDDIEDILENIPNEPQVACRMLFDARFPNHPYEQNGFNHPIDFAIESEWRYSFLI